MALWRVSLADFGDEARSFILGSLIGIQQWRLLCPVKTRHELDAISTKQKFRRDKTMCADLTVWVREDVTVS